MSKPTPNDLAFSEHDEWVRVEDGDIAVVGISHFAQDSLGEIVHCELPDLDQEVEAGQSICEVESVKAVAELYAPVGGTVIEVNDALDDEPELINADAYAAWIFKIKMSDPDEVSALMDAAAYDQKVEDAD